MRRSHRCCLRLIWFDVVKLETQSNNFEEFTAPKHLEKNSSSAHLLWLGRPSICCFGVEHIWAWNVLRMGNWVNRLLPWKRTNVPWKSMVGRCISLWTSPFLGGIRSFSGVHILHPSSSEAKEKQFIFLLWLSVSGFHGKMSPHPRCTYAFAKGKWVVWISRNTPVTTQVLPQITKEHQVMYCFQTLSQKNIYFVCTWHFWCKQSGVFFQLKRSGHIFFWP